MLTPDILKDTIKTKRESIKTDLEIVTKSHIHMQNERETDRKGVRDRESERQIDREWLAENSSQAVRERKSLLHIGNRKGTGRGRQTERKLQ